MAVTPQIAVALAQDVYRDPDRPPLPDGWTIFLNCSEAEQRDGYFGAAYQFSMNFNQAVIVIAHRGTDNLEGYWEDFEMWAFNTIPAQFNQGAIPFINSVFSALNNSTNYRYNTTYLYTTGHSLGGTLSELSIIRYIHYFDPGQPTYNPYRIWGNQTYVFESPGSWNLIEEQENDGEITRTDIADGGKTIEVYNSEVDAFNTCMPTSASRARKRIVAAIGNHYHSLKTGAKLPYSPSKFYYLNHYTIQDQHKIGYVYNWVNNLNVTTYSVIQTMQWPVGADDSYFHYKSYYEVPNRNFEHHNRYWQQYTTVLWNQNPSIQKQYHTLLAFQKYYYTHELNYFAGYLANIDASTLTSAQGVTVRFHGPSEPRFCGVSGIGDMNGDGIADYMMSVPWGDNQWQGRVIVIYGGKSGIINLNNLESSEGFIIIGLVNSGTGESISGTGDLNNDGIPDLLIAAPAINSNQGVDKLYGIVYVVYGGQSGSINLSELSISQGFTIIGIKGLLTGRDISATGDLNGDRIPDILIGAVQAAGYGEGMVWVVYGGQSGPINLANLLSSQGFAIVNNIPNATIGYSVSGTGDMNGDNIPDILISIEQWITIQSPASGYNQGSAYLIYGGQLGPISLATFQSSQGFIIRGPVNSNGVSVSGTNDVDGDDIPDLLVGITQVRGCGADHSFSSYNGIVYLIYGGQSGIIDLSTLTSSQGFEILSPICLGGTDDNYFNFGSPVSGLGDINGDGFADFAIGAIINGKKIVYVILGGQKNNIDVSVFPNRQGFVVTDIAIFRDPGNIGKACLAVGGTGDMNGDHLPEMVIGFPALEKEFLNENIGYIIYGRPQPTLQSLKNKKRESVSAKEETASEASTLPSIAENSSEPAIPYKSNYLNLSGIAGKQFNIFYQQAKEYLASFWRAATFQNKTPLSIEQIHKRQKSLEKAQRKLNELKVILDLAGNDHEIYLNNGIYLNKVITFYHKMITHWKEDVSSLQIQDIRDLQEDISKITHAIYWPNIPYIPTPTPRQPSSFEFFGGSLLNSISANHSAQAMPLLPHP